MSSQVFIRPVDVWLFRDGRPFSAGSDHRAESLFPPYPTVIQGAIRSNQLVRLGIDLNNRSAIEQAVGKPNEYRTLRLRGPYLAKVEANNPPVRYFPQPADAVSVGRHYIQPAQKPKKVYSGAVTSCPLPMLLGLSNPPGKGESGLWLSQSDLIAYLDGNPVEGVPSEELFIKENRPGIEVKPNTSTIKPGQLFEVGFVRLQDGIGLLVEMDGEGYDQWSPTGVLQLGGENRAATYEIKNGVSALSQPPVPLPAQFKIYFATPAYFTRGWLPSSWGKFFQGNVTLQAAAVGRYEVVGGVDLAHDRSRPDLLHRPSRRFVPAGSVYYFSREGQARLQPSLIQNAVTEFGPEIGFGQVLIKEW